ncbi:glutaminyl-peptide cyclotransferase [Pinirhizobacter sp.]|jgi:glutaminyl-peptide cyclotransferase|uniref:glutaminyl-peptide cyclotransferase n=1 Tax=Pinirhizobacter sp. TaxID=2950432 RepID=UPI002F3F737A
MRLACLAAVLLAAISFFLPRPAFAADLPIYDYQVVHAYPHDVGAFTEGLFYKDGFLYESTGLAGHSSIRKVDLATGEVIRSVQVPSKYFGEGIVDWGKELISLTYQTEVGFVRDFDTFAVKKEFHYVGEGWALTRDDKHIYMSDGTPDIRVLNPTTLNEERRIHVTLNGKPVTYVNELEWVKGQIYANVWQTTWILRIDPATGNVVGVIDLKGLKPADTSDDTDAVANGIAYDAKGDRLFVTGKNWTKLFEIRLKERPAAK